MSLLMFVPSSLFYIERAKRALRGAGQSGLEDFKKAKLL
jgi:hypothetical protein